MYNKTALNKIKKADLIQMFLDQQAKMNDMELATEQKKYVQNLVAETVHTIDKKDKEIEKLKEQNEKLKAGTLLKFQEVEIEDLTQEIQILKEILDEVRVYLGRFDGDEVEVFDMIVKGE